jgi:molecular chaperone DnaK
VHVSAKDLGTGKEQSIKITASSGLNEEEIKQMVRDAEAHASEDKTRKEIVEARNQLDSLIYSTEKSLKEHGADLEAGVKQEIEAALEKAKKTLDTQDAQALRSAAEELSRSSHKLAEAMYAKASQQQAAAQPEEPTEEQPDSTTTDGGAQKKEDVVDADFEEVKD